MRFIFLAVLTLLLAGCPPYHHLRAPDVRSQLTVRGEATLMFKPDQVAMSLEAVTSAEKVDEALAANSAAVVKLQQLLKTAGVGRDAYQTGQFSIQPLWSRPPRLAPANWTPEIIAYRVRNSLQVTTSRIDLTGRLLALAQQAGVNKLGTLKFSLADAEAASRQAIAAATKKARRRAEVLAQAAGVNLGRLLEARVVDGIPGAQPRVMTAQLTSARTLQNNVPISSGQIKVQAAVVLRYAVVGPGQGE